MTNLYVFGSGDCGQLGLGEDVDLKQHPTLHPYFADKNIVSVAAGGLHSLALSADGQVSSCLFDKNDHLIMILFLFRFILGDVMMRRPWDILVPNLPLARLKDWMASRSSKLLLVIPSPRLCLLMARSTLGEPSVIQEV